MAAVCRLGAREFRLVRWISCLLAHARHPHGRLARVLREEPYEIKVDAIAARLAVALYPTKQSQVGRLVEDDARRSVALRDGGRFFLQARDGGALFKCGENRWKPRGSRAHHHDVVRLLVREFGDGLGDGAGLLEVACRRSRRVREAPISPGVLLGAVGRGCASRQARSERGDGAGGSQDQASLDKSPSIHVRAHVRIMPLSSDCLCIASPLRWRCLSGWSAASRRGVGSTALSSVPSLCAVIAWRRCGFHHRRAVALRPRIKGANQPERRP